MFWPIFHIVLNHLVNVIFFCPAKQKRTVDHTLLANFHNLLNLFLQTSF